MSALTVVVLMIVLVVNACGSSSVNVVWVVSAFTSNSVNDGIGSECC